MFMGWEDLIGTGRLHWGRKQCGNTLTGEPLVGQRDCEGEP